MMLLIFLLMQLELDLNGTRFPIADVPNAVSYDYTQTPKVLIVKLDFIYANSFEDESIVPVIIDDPIDLCLPSGICP